MSHRSRLTLTALTLVAAGALAPQAQASARGLSLVMLAPPEGLWLGEAAPTWA